MCRCGRSSSWAPPAQARHRGPAAHAAGPAPSPPRSPRNGEVALHYLGQVPLLVKGAVSGRVYALRPGAARLECDARDAPSFLASPLFERVSRAYVEPNPMRS